MAKTLYEISAGYEELLDLCYDETADEETIRAKLETLDSELTDKVSNGIAVIQTLKATAEGMDAEIKRLTQSKRALENRVDFIKNYYLENLARIGKSKVLTPRGAMTISKAGGLKPLRIDDEDLIPLEYKREIIQSLIDKDAIREALERGMEIAGARLEERGKYLRIS